MIKSSPETKTNADLLKKELIDCLRILSQPGFSVRTSSLWQPTIECVKFQKTWYKTLMAIPGKLFIWYELRKIYLFYDAVHLVKNIRNNWLIIKVSFLQVFWF